MTISLDDINKVLLRTCFLPWFKETMASMGMSTPADWNPSDDELARLADRASEALRDREDS